MDITDHFSRIAHVFSFPRRIRELPLQFKKPRFPFSLTRVPRWFSGILALLLAAGFGIAAQQRSFQEGARDWELTHLPTLRIWQAALESRQFQELKNPDSIQKAAKTLPSMVDSAGSIWVSADLEWIALMLDHDATPI